MLLHRWVGLATAGFLFVSGLTGAVIAFDHALDARLYPAFYDAPGAVAPRDALSLADGLEAADPRLRVTWLPLHVPHGEAVQVFTAPRIDPARGVPFDLDFDQVALHPETGAVQGARRWGALTLRPEGLIPCLYRLHHTMHLPDVGGVAFGNLLMGLVAIAWSIDCVVALLIAFPSRAHWRRSFRFSWREGGRRLLFDLHRSGGVWIWGLLLTFAITAVSMNLGDTVVRPLLAGVVPLTPDPLRDLAPPPTPLVLPPIDRATAVRTAAEVAASRGWSAPGGIFYSAEAGRYAIGCYRPEAAHGDGGLGNPWVYVDGQTGAVVGLRVPGEGSWGDVFLQAQFPLHSGRILGLPGRILAAGTGVVVAGLSATGVLLWARRRLRAARPGSAS